MPCTTTLASAQQLVWSENEADSAVVFVRSEKSKSAPSIGSPCFADASPQLRTGRNGFAAFVVLEVVAVLRAEERVDHEGAVRIRDRGNVVVARLVAGIVGIGILAQVVVVHTDRSDLRRDGGGADVVADVPIALRGDVVTHIRRVPVPEPRAVDRERVFVGQRLLPEPDLERFTARGLILVRRYRQRVQAEGHLLDLVEGDEERQVGLELELERHRRVREQVEEECDDQPYDRADRGADRSAA